MTAEQYVPTEADPHIYQWQRGASLRFTGSLEDDSLNLDSLVEITFLAGKVTGTIRLKDGTVLRQDTGREKEGLKRELAETIRKEHPGAVSGMRRPRHDEVGQGLVVLAICAII